MGYFDTAIRTLESLGFTDVILPFLLIFTILYAVLQKMSLFGKDKKNFNIVVALALALSVVIPHVTRRYPAGYDVVEIINTSIPQVVLVIVLVIMVFMLIGLFGGEAKWAGNRASGLVALGAAGVVVYIFGTSAGWFSYLPRWLSSPQTQALIVILLVFGLVVFFVTRDEKSSAGQSIFKEIGEMFK